MTDPIHPATIAHIRTLLKVLDDCEAEMRDDPYAAVSASRHRMTVEVLGNVARRVLPALLDQIAAQAAEIEKWKQLSLVAEEVTDARLADLLECDAEAKGHAFSDAAAVFMLKAKRLQRECDVIRASRDDLEDERHRLAVKCEQAEARMRELYANGAQCRMEERDSARNERESYKRRLIEAQDSLAVHHRRADQAEARVRELEAQVATLADHAPPGHTLHSCGGPQEACVQPC